jgi:hypothetical protein
MSKIENLKDFLEKMHALINCYVNAHNSEKITQKTLPYFFIYFYEIDLKFFSVTKIWLL